MKLQANTKRDKRFLKIEDRARRNDTLTVEYRGKQGTIITGPEEAFGDLIDDMNNTREEYWEQMASDDTSLKAISDLEEKRREIKRARNGLRRALENPNHRWRNDC